jgi:hypothetical protein
MTRSIIVLLLVAVAGSVTLGQTRRDSSIQAEIVALENKAFEAWKNKDKKYFEENMSEDGQFLDLNGVGAKAQYVKAIIENNCTVGTYALDNTKVTTISKDVALLTYRYSHDAVCGGNPEVSPIWFGD